MARHLIALTGITMRLLRKAAKWYVAERGACAYPDVSPEEVRAIRTVLAGFPAASRAP